MKLDNLGLKVPQTYDELVKVLQEFKDKDANGNGDPTDEIPFGSGNFDPTFSYILPFNNRLGADNTYEMSVKDGKTCISTYRRKLQTRDCSNA